MRKLNRFIMTLALLIMAVGGAWADETLLLTIENKDYTTFKSGSMTFDDKVTVTFSNSVYNDGDGYGWYAGGTASLLTVAGINGYTITSCKFYTDMGTAANGYTVEGESPSVYLYDDNVYTDASESVNIGSSGIKKIEVYTAEPEITEWELKPDETGKKWILADMPASNVELQVEYFTESNLFLSKDALADKANIAVTAGELGVQFGEDGKSANTVTEGTPMTVTYNGTKKILGVNVAKKADNAYLKWDDGQKKLVATDIPTTATMVENNSNDYVEWAAGTYVVEGEVTINGMIGLNGNVELIIKDGAKLTAYQIWGGPSKYNLSIYGQANQTGQLVVNSSDDAITNVNTLEVHSAKVKSTSSTVDCGAFYDIKTFNVYGGSVDAENTGTLGYGILNGSMNIYGGDVKALGKGNKFGIAGSLTKVTVYGGKLWAGCFNNKAIDSSNVTLTKGAGFTGKIEISGSGESWSDWEVPSTPGTNYVRVGYN